MHNKGLISNFVSFNTIFKKNTEKLDNFKILHIFVLKLRNYNIIHKHNKQI